jgi:hypothetical protein
MAYARVAVCLSAMTFLAGCIAAPPMGGGSTGVEGDWIGTDGVAISSFSGGQFRSTATDTGNLLANGTYRYVSAGMVEITYFSILSQANRKANCALVDYRQLNCTDSRGVQSSLIRRA